MISTGPSVPGGQLYNEIGREMFAENHKRTNMIRWGLWDDVAKWIPPFYTAGDKIEVGAYRTLFPVHKDKISVRRCIYSFRGLCF